MSLSKSKLFNWFQPPLPDQASCTRDHILRGFLKIFLAYFVPLTLFRRKWSFQTFRRAVALGVFVAGVRAVDDILAKLKRIETASERDKEERVRDRERRGKEDKEEEEGEGEGEGEGEEEEEEEEVKEREKEKDSEVEVFVKKYSLGVAAFMSALVAITIDGQVQNSISLVLWTAVRAIRGFTPHVPFGSVLVLGISSSQILSTWLFCPEEHNPMYVKFLNTFGGLNTNQIKLLREHPIDACPIIHPGQTCLHYFFDFIIKALPRSFRLYLPVYLVTFLFSFSINNIPRMIISLLRSSLFLSLYCAVAFLSMCMGHAVYPGKWTRQRTFIMTSLTGLTGFVETPKRLGELATYCLTHALETCFHYAERRGYVTISPSLNMMVLALSAGVLLHHRDQQPKALVRWLFKLR